MSMEQRHPLPAIASQSLCHSHPSMRAMLLEQIGEVLPEGRPLVAREVEWPRPVEGEMLVEIAVCSVCHRELDEIEGRTPPAKLPMMMGHHRSAFGKESRVQLLAALLGIELHQPHALVAERQLAVGQQRQQIGVAAAKFDHGLFFDRGWNSGRRLSRSPPSPCARWRC